MKNAVQIAIFSFLFSVTVNAQIEDTSSIGNKDSVGRHQGINPNLKINYSFDFEFPFKYLSQSNKLIAGDKSTLWLRTEMAISYFSQYGSGNFGENNHLLLPFYNQYLENSKFDPIKYVLGIAQISAAGYLAYRHIKKYGFRK